MTAWMVFRRFVRHRGALSGAVFILLTVLAAILAPVIAPHAPNAQNLSQQFQLPGTAHWLGTDDFGRDALSRLIWGARISLSVGFISVSISMVGGVLIGLTTAYFGGWTDTILMRVMDVMLAFPGILLAIAMMAFLGPGLGSAMLAVGIVDIPVYARVSRSAALNVRSQDYLTAAISLGGTSAWVLFRHVLPNVQGILIVQATLGIAGAILSTASLSFLGLGVQPPMSDWGSMLSGVQTYIVTHPYQAVPPGVAIFLTVISFNLVGDGLRDAMDPRLR